MDEQAHKDFVSEAEDILENLEESISILMDLSPEDHRKPDLINAIFRYAHSLKGLSGMLNLDRISTLSHRMESLLDGIRLDKVPLTPEVVDALSDGVQLLVKMVRSVTLEGSDEKVEIGAFLENLERLKKDEGQKVEEALSSLIDAPAGLDEILSEYEEHRFRDNIGRRVPLYRASCEFPLATFDTELKTLTERIREVGELLTTLPRTEPSAEGRIGFLLYLASRESEDAIRGRLSDCSGLAVEAVAYRKAVPAATATPAPAERAEKPTATTPHGREDDREVMEEAKGISNTVRVDIGKLDLLMNLVGELVILKSSISSVASRFREQLTPAQAAVLSDLEKVNAQMEKRLVDLRDSVMDIRMVTMSQLFTRLQRVTKKIARDLRKPVRIEFSGGETELDKMIMEEMISPLVHIMRNAIDHGIEDASVRKGAGKKEEGFVRLSAYQQGNHVVIEVEDDGAGIDLVKVKAKAVAEGLLRKDEEITEENVFSILFRPGFSTKESVTEISGRGVGMNVVKEALDRVGGAVDIQTAAGRGTRVVLTLPITLAILQALMVRCGARIFAVPISSILEATQIKSGLIKTIEGREVITLRDKTLPLIRLERIYNLPAAEQPGEDLFVVVVGVGSRTMGLLVEQLVGKQDIVIKPLGEAFAGSSGFAGAAELGDQTTVLVLDVAGLLSEAVRLGAVRKA